MLQETEGFRYFDPKLLRATDRLGCPIIQYRDHVILSNSLAVPKNRSPFQEVSQHRWYGYASKCLCDLVQAIVFIVGGGNYIEYQNLQDYSKVSI